VKDFEVCFSKKQKMWRPDIYWQECFAKKSLYVSLHCNQTPLLIIMSAAPPLRRSTGVPSNSSAGAKRTTGRIDSLSREGIAPTSPSAGRASTSGKGSFRGTDGASSGEGMGWTRKLGRGILTCSEAGRAATVASETLTSATVIACELRPDCEKLASAEYTIVVQMFISSSQPAAAAAAAAGTAQVDGGVVVILGSHDASCLCVQSMQTFANVCLS
jgi:hypothetical protein